MGWQHSPDEPGVGSCRPPPSPGTVVAAPPGRAPMDGLTADQALFALELGTPTTQADVQQQF